MKWYDYVLCIACADIISTGIVNGNIIAIGSGCFAYFIWELIRKIEKRITIMCNCKGWDIAFYADEITVQQHFCRVFDDCGHVDNTLEETAREVAKYYRERANGCKENEEMYYLLLRESALWENLTHPSYLYYSGEESQEGDPL
jgi:hypothetical protein